MTIVAGYFFGAGMYLAERANTDYTPEDVWYAPAIMLMSAGLAMWLVAKKEHIG